jgi:hypothetical protein
VRALLDEQLPKGLARHLVGHTVDTVVIRGWAGVKNGELLRLMHDEYDVLITMDRGIEHQQNIGSLPYGVILVRAASNRMAHLVPLVPAILEALEDVRPGQIRQVGR